MEQNTSFIKWLIEFVFEDFFHFLGAVILIAVFFDGIASIISAFHK